MDFLLREVFPLLYPTAALYFVAFLVFRMMGKRSLGKMAPFDVAVIIIIGEAVAIAMEDPKRSLILGFIPIVFLGFLQIVLSWINLFSRTAERITQGEPTLLVSRGQVLEGNRRKERVSLPDLWMALREQGVRTVDEVAEARLEPTGKVSVLKSPVAASLSVGEAEEGALRRELVQLLDEQRVRLVREIAEELCRRGLPPWARS